MVYSGPTLGTAAEGYLIAVGQLTVSGNNVSGPVPQSVSIFDAVSCPWDVCAINGQDAGSGDFGALSGTLSARTALTLNGISFTYDALYSQGSSAQAIAGSWTAGYMFGPNDPTDTVDISASGAIASADPNSACFISGQVLPLNPAYDAYSVSMIYASCTDPPFNEALNGLQGQGTGYLDTTQSPVALHLVVVFANPSGLPFIGNFILRQQ